MDGWQLSRCPTNPALDKKRTDGKMEIDVPLVPEIFLIFFFSGPFSKPLRKMYFNKNKDFFKSPISCHFS